MAGKKINVDNEKDFKCTYCNNFKNLERSFYTSHSILFRGIGRICICKDCLVDLYNILFEELKEHHKCIYEICRYLDYCYNKVLCDAAIEQAYNKNSNVIQIYFQKLNSIGVKNGMGTIFKHSDNLITNNKIDEKLDDLINSQDNYISDELKNKWGNKYGKFEIIKLEKFYNDMITSHDIITPQHKVLLVLMCKLNLKMDKCLEEDDLSGFSKIHDQYQKILQSAGFRPIDRASADNAVGIKTFSQIYESVEKDGFIKPASIEENQDIVDKTIMYMLNYVRKLMGVQKLSLPPIDTPKVDEEDVIDFENIHVDMTKEFDENETSEEVGDE